MATGGIATADANPEIRSTYDMTYRVLGQSHFSLIKNRDGKSDSVTVTLEGISGESTLVVMNVQREDPSTCGIFSDCQWKWATMECLKRIEPNSSVSCRLLVDVRDGKHRLVLSKADDGKRITGNVRIR